MNLITNPDKSQWAELLKRPVMNTENLFDTVRAIIDRVKTEGDRAVLEYEEKFDKVALTALAVTEAEQAEAEALVGEELKKAIRLAKRNIETFHAAQRFESKRVETQPGVTCWQKAVAIEKVGLYIRIHGERHVGVGSEQCLVIEQSAHVAEDADLRLLAPDYVIAEAGGYVDDAVCLALFQHESGFFHIGAMRHDACFGTGIHFPQIFPAQGTARVVHHHGRHFTDCFVGIDERVYQRICQRNEYKEYQHTLVAKEVA